MCHIRFTNIYVNMTLSRLKEFDIQIIETWWLFNRKFHWLHMDTYPTKLIIEHIQINSAFMYSLSDYFWNMLSHKLDSYVWFIWRQTFWCLSSLDAHRKKWWIQYLRRLHWYLHKKVLLQDCNLFPVTKWLFHFL